MEKRRTNASFKKQASKTYGKDRLGKESKKEARFAETQEEIREDRLEGRNPLQEALRAGRTIDKLWVLEGLMQSDAYIRALVHQAEEQGAVVMHVQKMALDKMSQTKAHQGLIAQVAMQEYVELYDLLENLKEQEENGKAPFLLIADEIQDAYNLGAMFRIAEAAGVDGILIPKRRQVSLDAVVAKASAGAIAHVPCVRVGNLVQAIETLKSYGYWVASTCMNGENVFESKQLQGPLAIVIGNEGKGVSPLVRKNCDFHLSIPMHGKLNSLNAAVACGIVVFEAVHKRKK